jgi:acyl-CoA reductase-like NAD-dependent aldehyde dehydrogenase
VHRAADRILTGKLYNAGQTCLAPDYALVQHRRVDAFVDAARRAISTNYPSLAQNHDYTRIINDRHLARLTALVDDARRLGATVVEVRPAGESGGGRVFPPTLIVNVHDEMAVMQEEIFGPVLPIRGYEEVGEAVDYVNARPHPLALYYFDHDARRVRRVLERAVAGGVTVNDCIFHVAQTALPFGGVGTSGMGRYHGVHGFQTFSNRKAVFLQSRWSALAMLRPPYTERTRRLIRFMLGG